MSRCHPAPPRQSIRDECSHHQRQQRKRRQDVAWPFAARQREKHDAPDEAEHENAQHRRPTSPNPQQLAQQVRNHRRQQHRPRQHPKQQARHIKPRRLFVIQRRQVANQIVQPKKRSRCLRCARRHADKPRPRYQRNDAEKSATPPVSTANGNADPETPASPAARPPASARPAPSSESRERTPWLTATATPAPTRLRQCQVPARQCRHDAAHSKPSIVTMPAR